MHPTRRHWLIWLRVAALLTMGSGVVSACGSSPPPAAIPAEHESWARQVPSSFASTDAEIVYVNVAAAIDNRGSFTPNGTDNPLPGTPIHAATSGMGQYDRPDVWRWKYGVALPDVAVAVTARVGETSFTMLRPIEPIAFDDLLAEAKSDPDWGDKIFIAESNGLPYIDWGGEIDPALRSPGRPQGVGGYAAVIGDWVAFSQRENVITELLAVAAGAQESILADDDVRHVLSLVPTADLESMVVLYSASPSSPWQPPGMRAASGFYRSGDEQRSTVVYYGPDDWNVDLKPADRLGPEATVRVDGRSLTIEMIDVDSFIVGAECLGLGGCLTS